MLFIKKRILSCSKSFYKFVILSKSFSDINFSMKKVISCLGVLLFLMLSCIKEGDMVNRPQDGMSGSMAVLAVFNVVEASDQLDVFLNNDPLNKVTETLRYGEILRHRTVFAGKITLTARVRYGGAVQMSAPKELTLESGKNYSLFLYGKNANHITLVEDNLILPPPGKFKVRFANFNGAQDIANIGNQRELRKYFNLVKPSQVTDFIELDIQENSFLMSADGQSSNMLPIQLNPHSRGVYTVLVTAPRIDLNSGSFRTLFSVIRHP